MPNWCNNVVTLTHEDPAKVQAAVDAFKEDKLLAHLYPEPNYKETPVAPAFPEIVGTAEATVRDDAWWDWRVTNWGTKWDVGGGGDEDPEIVYNGNSVTFYFDSAWSPPVGVYDRALEDDWEVTAYYYEPGMGFAGMWTNGDDDYYDLPETAEEVRDLIPEALDDMFGISENMEMWADEDEEDED